MFLMAEQYNLELLIEAGGRSVPSPTVKFWRESLKELSPMQMLEGLRGYMKSERGRFKPTPGEIENNAPQATDRPRKVFDPKCRDCSGTGFRKVLVDSKIHLGKKAQRVQNCYCERTVYGGQEFKPEVKQLPPTNEEAAAIMGKLAKELPGLDDIGKKMPERREMTDEEKVIRRDQMKAAMKERGLLS
jgi:hypothetical protein